MLGISILLKICAKPTLPTINVQTILHLYQIYLKYPTSWRSRVFVICARKSINRGDLFVNCGEGGFWHRLIVEALSLA
jgi:hypothetical protein